MVSLNILEYMKMFALNEIDSIELLKVGGKITYSTCSLNPIENESVVAAVLKKYAGKIRLLEA